MSSSLRDRVKQILMENSGATPGTYFGGRYCCQHCGMANCRGCMGTGYGGMVSGGAKVNPWIEAVKKYGSVAEAKKFYKKATPAQAPKTSPAQTPAPTQSKFLSQERKDEARAKLLMRRDAERQKQDEELAKTMIAQRQADYKQAKRLAPKRFTRAKADSLVKKMETVLDKFDFTDEEVTQFGDIIRFVKGLPSSRILRK